MSETSHFFAYLSKLRWIERWGMKRNAIRENVMEHSFEVAVVAHALGEIHNRDNAGKIDLGLLVLTALYHDASEVLTGDLPSPIKYHNDKIRDAYKEVEHAAEREMLAMLPQSLQASYAPYLLSENVDPGVKQLVKAADLIVAYTKCKAETVAGNPEFSKAMRDMEEKLQQLQQPEVREFCERFLPSFELTLDELIRPNTIN
ncbi:MAG TPA: 5'-deoxynucleotidase [Pseudomonadales bacterium]|nr:5'-deoxynucleotidase [Pseudomonadales bacterium]